jgi:hypothetical protein
MATKSRRRRLAERQQEKNQLLRALQANVQLGDQLQELQKSTVTVRVLVMALLGQAGGSLEVTQGTLQQAQENFQNLGWSVVAKKDDPKTYVVTLTYGGKDV